ncbi:MAG: hypothetical protein WAV38_21530 [Xanthobacteraceae bacterium]
MNDRGKPDEDSIPTLTAWHCVAKMLFPEERVRWLTERDRWLVNRYRLSDGMYFPVHNLDDDRILAPNELIAEVDRAYFRQSLQNAVDEWFIRRGFDPEGPTISKHSFEAAFQAEFGQLPPEPVKPLAQYKRYTTDDVLVVEGVNGIRSGTWSNPSQAAKALANRAEGSSHDSTVDRLRKKIGAALEG